MASINKLSIRGVRAFSPDDQEQVIEFYFPVTVIVGANGCGKTTIIESLKYAVTGSLPPGVKSGQAFVHDPKSIGQTAVKANIKLRFTNRAGQQMVVVRSMEVTQKKTTMSFKALDGILRTTDSNGEKVSLSHKCSELDRQIPMLLGVGKPILDNVVFCHQEDSSWPLMEGAVLKKRFDDIFDSTRYAKALKAIQETKKEYTSIVKDLKADLAGLSAHKQAAKGFRQDLEKVSEDLEDLEEGLEGCNNDIKQVNEEIRRNQVIAQQVEMQRLTIEDKETELAKEISVLEAHRNMLPEDLTTKHNTHQLKDMLRDFDARMTTQLEKRRDLQRDLQAADAAMKAIAEEDKSLREQIGKLQAQKSAHEERLQRRLKHMDAMAKGHEIELPVTQTQTQNTSFTSTQHSLADESMTTVTGGTQETMITVTAEDMHSFFKAVNEKEADLKGNLASRREAYQQEGDKIQEDLNKMSAEVNGADNEFKKLETELEDIRSELSNIASQSSAQHSRVRQADIDNLREKATAYAKQRDEANNNKDLKEIPAQIRAKESQIDMLKREIEDDNTALRELRLNTDAQNSITVLKEQAVSELESLKEALNDNSFLFTKFNLTAPALPDDKEDDDGDLIAERLQNFSNAINDKNETIQQELTKAKDDLVGQERVVSEKSALLAHTKSNLASLRSKLDSLGGENGSVGKFQRAVAAVRQYEQNAGMTPVLEGNDPQDVMAHLSSRLEEIEKESSATIQPETLTNLLDQLYKMSAVGEGDNKKVQCPCCTRDFDGIDDVRKFKESLDRMKDEETSELLRANKQAIEKSRAMKAEYQNWRNVVSETMQGVMDWTRMTTEAKDAEVTIRDIEQDLTACSNELDALKDAVSELQGNADEIRDLYESSRRWTEDASRLSRKRMEIYQKKTDLSISTNTTTDRDLQTVEEDLSRRQAEKDSLNNQINQLNKKMTKLNSTIANLSQQATNLEKLANDKQKKFENEQQSTIRKQELKDRQGVINDQLPKLKTRLQNLKGKVRSKEGDRKRFRKSSNDDLQTLSEKLRNFERDVSTLRQIQSEIDAYLESSKEEDLDRINAKISSLAKREAAKSAEAAKIKPELAKLCKKIDDQASQEKLIKENLKMIEMKDKIAKLEAAVSEANVDMEKVEGYDKYEDALRSCQKQLSKLHQTRAHHDGRRSGFIEQVRGLKRKLKGEDYKDIDERHRVVVIKHETTQIAVRDLEKYHSALDNALLRYHGIKIEEINRIIRELWNLTYKGEDITNIELESGQEKNARKSYNYRVVMSKGSTKLDMRGRCSAGQRVLASIVIRMALAETFCVNCGCIALDEPTVNLDYNNKQGLAIALAQIISSRAQQSNFQLIVITHDEEFVSMMKSELASQSGFSIPEKYFQVRREEAADGKYYSKIDAIDWDELV